MLSSKKWICPHNLSYICGYNRGSFFLALAVLVSHLYMYFLYVEYYKLAISAREEKSILILAQKKQ